MATERRKLPESNSSFFANAFGLLKQTGQEFLEDKAPPLGAALCLLHGLFTRAADSRAARDRWNIFRDDPAGAWNKMTQQMSYFLDPSAVEVAQNIAHKASQPGLPGRLTDQPVP